MCENGKAELDRSQAQTMLSWALTEHLGGSNSEVDESELELPGYDLLGILGRGGMGTVYRAREQRLDRTVALKVFTAQGGDQELFVQRLKREGRLMAKLEHPNVLGIYDAAMLDDGTAYLSLEYVEGEDLQKRLLEKKRLKVKEAIRIAVNVCNGLSAVHALGIVHRDIKPANVLLGADGSVKVTDFGVSKESDLEQNTSLTMTGTAIGSVDYMSPEQSRGEPLDARSDIYSVGILLYEMLSGMTPRGVIKPLAKRGVPKELDKLVMRCLQREPTNRPASAANLALRLKKIYQKTSARRRRDTSSKWYAAAAGVAALGVLAMFLAREMRAEKPLRDTAEKVANTQPQPVAEPLLGWRDLTENVDVKRNTLAGQWWHFEGNLVCADEGVSQLALDARPSGEYQLECAFTRVSGDGEVVLRLPSAVGMLSLQFRSSGVSVAELLQIESKAGYVKNGALQRVRVKVTEQALIYYADGLLVERWDFADLERREHPKWGVTEGDRVALAVDEAQVIFREFRIKQQ